MSGRRERWDDGPYLPDAKAHVPNHSTHCPAWWRLTGALTHFATHIHGENCLEKKSYFSPHTIRFSFHFFYVKTAVDTASRSFTRGKGLCLFQERQSIILKRQFSGWCRDQAQNPLAKMLYPSLTLEFPNRRVVKTGIHPHRGLLPQEKSPVLSQWTHRQAHVSCGLTVQMRWFKWTIRTCGRRLTF